MSDSLQEARERFQAATNSAAADRAAKSAAPPQKAVPKAGARAKANAGRFPTLNGFRDVIARHLTPAEQIVWHHLYRWGRDGIVSASTRETAAACGIDKVTVTRAMKKLKTVGLVWDVKLSRNKGTASIYGLHPQPDACLRACMDAGRRQKPGP